MNRRIVVLWTGWGVVLLLAAVDLAWHYPQLPERVATHFNAAGVPDGWSARGTFLTQWITTLVLVSLLFPGLRLLMGVLPARWINMPRRDYWFAPGREAYTRAIVGELMLWLGFMMIATMSGLNHLAMRANLSPTPELGPWLWVIVGTNLSLMLIVMLLFTVRFARPPR